MIIKTKPLQDALVRLRGITGGRTTLPILAHVRLEATDNNLSITGTDMDAWILEKVECAGNIGPINLNFKHLESSIGGEQVEIIQEGGFAIIKHGSSIIKLPISMDDFPAFPDAKYKVQGVNLEILADAIHKVKFAPDTKNDNITRTCIHIASKPKELYVEGTNGRCAAAVCENIIGATFDAVAPIGVLTEVANQLAREGAEFHLSDRTIMVKHNAGVYVCKLLDDHTPYPNTAGFLRAKRETLGEVALKPILATLEACLAVANGDLSANAQLVFSKTGLWFGYTSGSTQIENTFEGKFPDFKLGIHCLNFSRCLKAIKEEKATFSYSDNAIFMESGNLLVCSAKMIAK